ncbi:unnamed protein product [Polarella glacialis]|uniref:Uncharacterized protein n=1 Tax=Polarella glacialis TaxID=89957 RepID=A0A813FEG1_POLGL|nr:unnamed protein product [Polarella glacialis]
MLESSTKKHMLRDVACTSCRDAACCATARRPPELSLSAFVPSWLLCRCRCDILLTDPRVFSFSESTYSLSARNLAPNLQQVSRPALVQALCSYFALDLKLRLQGICMLGNTTPRSPLHIPSGSPALAKSFSELLSPGRRPLMSQAHLRNLSPGSHRHTTTARGSCYKQKWELLQIFDRNDVAGLRGCSCSKMKMRWFVRLSPGRGNVNPGINPGASVLACSRAFKPAVLLSSSHLRAPSKATPRWLFEWCALLGTSS